MIYKDFRNGFRDLRCGVRERFLTFSVGLVAIKFTCYKAKYLFV